MDIGGCSNTLSSSSMGKADANEQELDDVCIMQSCQSNVHGGKVHEVPINGMEFDSEQHAFDYYSEYAHRIGFSVRKQHMKKRAGIVARRTLCCSKQGERGFDKRRVNVLYHRPLSRVGCKAHMTFLLQKNGKFKVVAFNAEHNHAFAPSPAKHMLRSKRRLSFTQTTLATDAIKVGVSVKKTFRILSRQAGGREHVGFLDVDYANYLYRTRATEMKKGDAGALLEYFQKMKLQDPSFFYSIQLDENDLITNIFWADSRSVVDYKHFGDVVCFDTTYRTNDYGRPFAPFLGVNHHKQTVIFGGALLYDETTESFKWLFRTFLSAMSEKQPKTILTDQSAAMASAIGEVFHETNHRLCVWHIYQNTAKHLSHVFHASKEFASDLSSCVYDYEDEDEWMHAWNQILKTYSLQDNDWLKGIFELREKWAMVYGRHMFTADMRSTQRSESINHVLKQYLDPRHNFLRFFEQYDLFLQDRRYTELKSEFKMRQTAPVPVANVEMLRHAVEVYTPEMFNMFQHEYVKAWDYSIHKVCKSGNISDYKIICSGKGREHRVKFEAETTTVQCSCMKISFVGILCRHALKVLDKKNVKSIPPQYILKRWTKDAKDAIVSDYRGTQIQGNSQESIGKRYSYLSHDFQELVTLAAKNEDMYTYAHQNLSKLLKDLEEMKRTYCSNTWDPDTNTEDDLPRNVSQLNDGAVSQCPRGIKVKATVGRPRKRFKDPLEQPRRRRSQAKATQGTSSSGQGSQQKGRKLGQSANQEEHYDKENEISTVIDITVNNEHDVGDDTLFPPTQASSTPYGNLQQQNRDDSNLDREDAEGGCKKKAKTN